MFLFEEDEPVNVVAHQQDLKDLFPDLFHYNSIMLGNFSLFTHPYGNEFFFLIQIDYLVYLGCVGDPGTLTQLRGSSM